MATDEIAVAGANQFNNDLTFTKVTVPPLNHWTVVIDNLAAMIQNAADSGVSITISVINPTSGDVVMLIFSEELTELSPDGFAGPSLMGCGLPVPREDDGTLYRVHVDSVGKTTDGIIAWSYRLGLLPRDVSRFRMLAGST